MTGSTPIRNTANDASTRTTRAGQIRLLSSKSLGTPNNVAAVATADAGPTRRPPHRMPARRRATRRLARPIPMLRARRKHDHRLALADRPPHRRPARREPSQPGNHCSRLAPTTTPLGAQTPASTPHRSDPALGWPAREAISRPACAVNASADLARKCHGTIDGRGPRAFRCPTGAPAVRGLFRIRCALGADPKEDTRRPARTVNRPLPGSVAPTPRRWSNPPTRGRTTMQRRRHHP